MLIQSDGLHEIPSTVFLDDDGSMLVGQTAADLAIGRPDRAIQAPKEKLSKHAPVVVGGRAAQPVDLAAAIYRTTMQAATSYQGSLPARTRLTYPAMWSGPLKARLLEAATKAGLPLPELVAEPVAAALTYSERDEVPVGASVAVFDLGGGTFDAVVLSRQAEAFVIGGRPIGDQAIGGELFDELLMNEIGQRLGEDRWDQLIASDDPAWRRSARRLRNECKRAKEALTRHSVADVVVSLPDGLVEARVTQQDFEALIQPFVDEAVVLLRRCIARSGLEPTDLHAIYLAGGASRIPLVRRAIVEAFPTTPLVQQGDPKAATALGALMATATTSDQAIGLADEPIEPYLPPPPVQSPSPPAPNPAPNPAPTPTPPVAPKSRGDATTLDSAQPPATASHPPPVPLPPQRPKKRAPLRGQIIPIISGVFGLSIIAGAGIVVANGLGGGETAAPAFSDAVETAPPSASVSSARPPTSTTSPAETSQAPGAAIDLNAIVLLPTEVSLADEPFDFSLVCDIGPADGADRFAESATATIGSISLVTAVGAFESPTGATDALDGRASAALCAEGGDVDGEAVDLEPALPIQLRSSELADERDGLHTLSWDVRRRGSGEVIATAHVVEVRVDEYIVGIAMIGGGPTVSADDETFVSRLLDDMLRRLDEGR